MDYAEQAIEACRIVNDKKTMADALRHMGIVCRHRDAFEDALKHYESALELQNEIKDENGTASTLNSIGLVLTDLCELQSALEHLERSLQIKRRLGDRTAVATAQLNIGIIRLQQANYGSADKCFSEAAGLLGDVEDQDGIATVLVNLALLHAEQVDTTRALKELNVSIQMCNQLGRPRGVYVAQAKKATILADSENWDEALEQAELAAAGARKESEKEFIAECLSVLCRANAGKGQIAVALKLGEEGLSVARGAGMPEQEIIARLALGEAHFRSARTASSPTKETRKARTFVSQALLEASNRDMKRYVSKAERLLDQINEVGDEPAQKKKRTAAKGKKRTK